MHASSADSGESAYMQLVAISSKHLVHRSIGSIVWTKIRVDVHQLASNEASD